MIRWKLLIFAVFCGLLCTSAVGRAGVEAVRPEVLWVREVNGRALYWVNERPVERAPLSGLGAILPLIQKNGLIVILDWHVPISEIGAIDGILGKLPYEGARYFVYVPEVPHSMSEIIWKQEMLPLPQKPPSIYKGSVPSSRTPKPTH